MRVRAAFRHPTAAWLGTLQLGAAAIACLAPFVGAGPGWWLAVPAMMFLYGCIGMSVGYHRYFSHRSFETSRAAEIVFMAIGVMACIGTPAGWMVAHRRHHLHADRDGDPYPATDTMLRTLFFGRYYEGIGKYALHRELRRDPLMRWIHFRYLPLALAWPLALAAIDPLAPIFLWGMPVALTITSATLTHYVCHKWGTRPHDTPDRSQNNWLIALVSWGEGWHNNHHASPRKPCFSERWWQVDIGGLACRCLSAPAR